MTPEDFVSSVKNVLRDLGFPEVGEVISFDKETQRAKIRLLTRTVLDDDTEEDKIDINDIPVYYPTFGKFLISGPVEVGAEVLVICTGRDIKLFKQNGGRHTPLENSILHWTDAVAIPWNLSRKKLVSAFTSSFWFGTKTGTAGLEVTGNDRIWLGSGAVDVVTALHELTEQVSKIVTSSIASTAMTATGPAPLDPATLNSLADVLLAVSSIKAQLEGIKK